MRLTLCLLVAFAASVAVRAANLPAAFDLTNVDGTDYVTSVKDQQGGTCWTFGTMAAIEGNLLKTGAWTAAGESGEPYLAEYHLDWWNGFNSFWNADIAPKQGGLDVHDGGNYKMSTAYLSRGTGAVRGVDANVYRSNPAQDAATYHHFYAREVDWINSANGNAGLDRIKTALMENGVVGTGLEWGCAGCFNSSDNTYYKPASQSGELNHAVAIVGWDDNKTTLSPHKGAWHIKNSWGTGWGESGYFWISYDDKFSGHDPEMGAVSFNHVEPMRYDNVYYHDYHGWTGTKADASEAFNVFTAKGNEQLKAVSFFTAVDNVTYTATVYRTFANGQLSDAMATQTGQISTTGFHTIDLDAPVTLSAGQKFYVYLSLSQGGQPLDRSADVSVVTGSRAYHTMVTSTAQAGNSYYRSGTNWVDLTTYDDSASFCIKALTVN